MLLKGRKIKQNGVLCKSIITRVCSTWMRTGPSSFLKKKLISFLHMFFLNLFNIFISSSHIDFIFILFQFFLFCICLSISVSLHISFSALFCLLIIFKSYNPFNNITFSTNLINLIIFSFVQCTCGW